MLFATPAGVAAPFCPPLPPPLTILVLFYILFCLNLSEVGAEGRVCGAYQYRCAPTTSALERYTTVMRTVSHLWQEPKTKDENHGIWSSPAGSQEEKYNITSLIREAYLACPPYYICSNLNVHYRLEKTRLAASRIYVEKLLMAIRNASMLFFCGVGSVAEFTEHHLVNLSISFVPMNQIGDIKCSPLHVPITRNKKPLSVLSVGCTVYTLLSEYYFDPEMVSFTTCELNPKLAMFGSSQLHIIDNFFNLINRIEKHSVDVLLFLGVFGYGLNSKSDASNTVAVFEHLLSVALYVVYCTLWMCTLWMI